MQTLEDKVYLLEQKAKKIEERVKYLEDKIKELTLTDEEKKAITKMLEEEIKL